MTSDNPEQPRTRRLTIVPRGWTPTGARRLPGRPRWTPRSATGPLLHVVSFDLLRKVSAPADWLRTAQDYGVEQVWLVDDWQLTSSYHHPSERTIYVNTRGSGWYVTAMEFGVERYTEAVTLWFLHELGHAAHAHTGAGTRALRFGGDDPYEVQAWHFALVFRQSHPECWQALEAAYRAWYGGYRHRRQDWPDDLDEARAAGWPGVPYRAWPALSGASERPG